MKNKPLLTILGLTPGSRHLGISVFQAGKLVFYGVKTFKKRTPAESLKNLKAIIQRLVKSYQVEEVALEKAVFVQQHRAFVKIVAEEIKDYLKELRISFSEYNPAYIRQTICGYQKSTNQNTALLLSKQYQELARFANRSRIWQKYYFNYLFGAIAVGLVRVKELNEFDFSEIRNMKSSNLDNQRK